VFDVRGIMLNYAEGQFVNCNCVRDRIIVRQVKSSRFVQARRSSARGRSGWHRPSRRGAIRRIDTLDTRREGYTVSFRKGGRLVYFVLV
jgi:hypothetical protein